MKKAVFLSFILFFLGCSVVPEHSKEINKCPKCYIDNTVAPFWICYQSYFMSVGKVITKHSSNLLKEEAYVKAVNNLIQKLQIQTGLLLKKAKINNKNVLKEIKAFVIINANEGNSWYDKKTHILYVEANINKKAFENFLKEKLKIKNFKILFDEIF